MDNLEDIKEEHRVDLAKSLVTGVIFGLYALMGTLVGNFIWYQLTKEPELILFVGYSVLGVFVVLSLLIFYSAYRILKK